MNNFIEKLSTLDKELLLMSLDSRKFTIKENSVMCLNSLFVVYDNLWYTFNIRLNLNGYAELDYIPEKFKKEFIKFVKELN